MVDLSVLEIPFGSDEQKESVKLRFRVLRQPLGLNFDAEDLAAEFIDYHVAAFHDHHLVGVLLLRPLDAGTLKMRQVAVDFDWQGTGVGKSLVKFSEQFGREKGFGKIELHARENAVPFYLSLGYALEGELFYEVGIPHRKMHKKI